MKKLFSVVLTMFIISALILQPVYAAVYIDHDFNEGIVTESVTTTKVSDFYIFSGESYLWKTTIKNLAGNNQSYFKYVLGDDAGNATGFIMGQGKFNNPVDLTMDMRDEEGIAYPVTGDNVCIDIRIKRTGTNEAGAKLVYMDENNKVIGYLHFVGSSANPTLRAGGSVSALCDGGYAYNTWWYYRMLINFTDKTFTAFHGTSSGGYAKIQCRA